MFAGRYAVRDRCLFVLGVTSGFRVSELLSLRLRDVVRGGLVVRDVTVPHRVPVSRGAPGRVGPGARPAWGRASPTGHLSVPVARGRQPPGGAAHGVARGRAGKRAGCAGVHGAGVHGGAEWSGFGPSWADQMATFGHF